MPKTALHPELINIAASMDAGELKKLGATVVEEYDSDVQSRVEWEDKHKKWAEIYYQTDKPAQTDKGWGATQSVPLLTEACNQFAARSRKAFFPNRDFVATTLSSLGTFPPGIPDEEVIKIANERKETYQQACERVRKHMNYMLTVKSHLYKQRKDALWLSMAVHGSVFTKAYWDINSKQPRVDTVRATDLVVPYNAGPVAMEELPRKTHKLFWSVLRVEKLKRDGFFVEAADATPNIQQHLGGVIDAADEADGVGPSQGGNDGDHSELVFILEQHRYWEIDTPGKKQEKLIMPVIVWVDYNTQKVLRLTIRYETDDFGNPIDNRNPVEYFTHYKFLENPDGFYGYGYGHMLGGMNLAINDILRLSLDASLLATEGNMSGFISQRLVPQDDAGAEIEMSLGKFTTVPDTIENIASGIKTMEFQGVQPAMVDLLTFLDARGQRLGSVTEATTGQVDKIRQSNALMTELEQALELPSNIHMRIVDSLTDELNKIYRLCRVNMEDRVVFMINDEVQIVTKQDYALDTIVTPVFDPKMATMAQKIARAQTELDAVLKNPTIQNRPDIINKAFKRFFEAIETEDVDDLVPEEEDDQPEPARIDDQREENKLFLLPAAQIPLFDVFEDQNHEEHLALIEELVNSPYAAELDPQAAEMLKQHRQKHVAFLYAKEVGLNGPAQTVGMEEAAYGMGPAGDDEGSSENSDVGVPANAVMVGGGELGETA